MNERVAITELRATLDAKTAECVVLRDVAQLVLDFYHLPTEEFVTKHGVGFTTRMLGDRARAALSSGAEAAEVVWEMVGLLQAMSTAALADDATALLAFVNMSNRALARWRSLGATPPVR